MLFSSFPSGLVDNIIAVVFVVSVPLIHILRWAIISGLGFVENHHRHWIGLPRSVGKSK
jgi:hypothetical protein